MCLFAPLINFIAFKMTKLKAQNVCHHAGTATHFVSPNDKVKIAFIGIGNRGEEDALEFIKTGLCDVVALCDVDMGAKHTQKIMSMFPKVPHYQDFRKMFDQMSDKIDAVSIAVPDCSHFAIAIEAMQHHKDDNHL